MRKWARGRRRRLGGWGLGVVVGWAGGWVYKCPNPTARDPDSRVRSPTAVGLGVRVGTSGTRSVTKNALSTPVGLHILPPRPLTVGFTYTVTLVWREKDLTAMVFGSRSMHVITINARI